MGADLRQPPTPAADPGTRSAVFRDQGRLTWGIILGVTMVAFEALAVVTIAPAVAEALGGVRLYGWIFSSFFLATLFGAVAAGHWLDQGQPQRVLATALVTFAIGLLAGGLAPSMIWLLVARAVQGLGGGAIATALYVSVTRAYGENARPRVMALMSSAWVVPAMLGPAVAGLVADTLGWRAVFLGLLPGAGVVAVLTLPAFADLGSGAARQTLAARMRAAAFLTVGAFAVLLALDHRTAPTLLAGVAGLPLAIAGIRRLLPPGTLTLRRGLAAAVASRGLVFPAFITVETVLSLMLVSHLGYPAFVAGVILALGSLSWTGGAWLQDRWDRGGDRNARGTRIAVGAGVVATGVLVVLSAVALPGWALALAAAGWALAGVGIGLAHSSSSVHALTLAGAEDAGSASTALQVVDQLGAALGTGLGGAIIAVALGAGLGPGPGIAVALGLCACVAVAGAVAGLRSRSV